MALTAIVQNISFLMPSADANLQAADIRADATFWDVLRQLLVRRHKPYNQVSATLQVFLTITMTKPKASIQPCVFPLLCTSYECLDMYGLYTRITCDCLAANSHNFARHTQDMHSSAGG